MRHYIFCLLLFFLLAVPAVNAADPDYLSMRAQESEIKAIAVVASVRDVSHNSDGTFKQVTFKKIYALTPYTAKKFVGGCRTMEARWQRRSPDTIYYKPRRGQKVFVTVSYDGGAITSYTLLNRRLETVVREAPHRIGYAKGHAVVLPDDN